MKLATIIRRRIRRSQDGIDVVLDVNAAVAANVGERDGRSVAASQQTVHRHSRAEARATGGEEPRRDNPRHPTE